MLLQNPFLSHLLHHLDVLESSSLPLQGVERQFLLRLLLHQQMAAIRQRSAKDFIDAFKPDRFSTQPIRGRDKGGKEEGTAVMSEVAMMLQPLRAFVQARVPSPPPALSSYLALCSRSGGRLPSSVPTTPVSGRSGASSISPASFADEGGRSNSPSPLPMSGASPLPFDQLVEHVQRAQRTHLSSTERHAVIDALNTTPSMVHSLLHHGVIGPPHLPALIEKNPAVAVALLQVILTPPANPELSTAMLSPLLQLDLSLHSMEVVNRLATPASGVASASPTPSSPSSAGPSLLPPEFLPAYLHHCIECCRGIRDKYGQSRMVRLVCVFLQSLLRGERREGLGEGLDGLSSELMSFCVDFSKVKEAAALFRILKEWEAAS